MVIRHVLSRPLSTWRLADTGRQRHGTIWDITGPALKLKVTAVSK